MKKSKKMKIFLRKVISIIKLPEMRILPGHLAFFLVISIIPLIALVGAIGSEFGLPATSIKEILESVVPSDVINYLIPVVAICCWEQFITANTFIPANRNLFNTMNRDVPSITVWHSWRVQPRMLR